MSDICKTLGIKTFFSCEYHEKMLSRLLHDYRLVGEENSVRSISSNPSVTLVSGFRGLF